MAGRRHRRGVADPLDMAIFESDDYALPGWDTLSAHKDRLWTKKQCKKYIIASHIARLWNCDDMEAVRGWVSRWEFRKTACAIPQFAQRYEEVIRFTRGGQNLPTYTYTNLAMVYAEVMLGKRVNWDTMTAHYLSHINVDAMDIPTHIDWNGGLMEHAIMNGLLRQGYVAAEEIPRSPRGHTGSEDSAWNVTSGGEQYGGWDSWNPQGRGGGNQYRAWGDDHHGRGVGYTDVRSTWGGREGSMDEDRYPYAWREGVDDIVCEEDFQDTRDDNYRVPQYPPFSGNAYERTERYPTSPPFRASGWDDDTRLRTRPLGDDEYRGQGGGGESSRDINRDDQNIQGYHNWQGSTSTGGSSQAWDPWPYYHNP